MINNEVQTDNTFFRAGITFQCLRKIKAVYQKESKAVSIFVDFV